MAGSVGIRDSGFGSGSANQSPSRSSPRAFFSPRVRCGTPETVIYSSATCLAIIFADGAPMAESPRFASPAVSRTDLRGTARAG